MDKDAYVKLLKGGGNRYKNGNLYMLPNKAATVEERAAGKVCPPPKLNPDYAVDQKTQRVGKIIPRQQQRSRPPSAIAQAQIPPEVLRLIYGQR
jgi:hypothetical protein